MHAFYLLECHPSEQGLLGMILPTILRDDTEEIAEDISGPSWLNRADRD